MDANVSPPKRARKEVVRVTAVRLGRLFAFLRFFKPRCRQLDLSFPGSDPACLAWAQNQMTLPLPSQGHISPFVFRSLGQNPGQLTTCPHVQIPAHRGPHEHGAAGIPHSPHGEWCEYRSHRASCWDGGLLSASPPLPGCCVR